MNLAIAFLLCCLQQPMTFKVPDGSSEQDVKLSVKAINARIIEYGYKEITVSAGAENKTIVVASATPFNNVVRTKIFKLCTTPASSIELRFAYPLTSAEAEQYRPGEAAPKGAKWVKWTGGIALIRDEPVHSVKDTILWYPKKKEGNYDSYIQDLSHLEFGEAISRKLYALPKTEVVKVRLFVDGKLVDIGGNLYPQPTVFKWTIPNPDGWDILGVCLNHPVPLALTH